MKCLKCKNKVTRKEIKNGGTIYFCNNCGEEYYEGPKDIMDISNVDISKIEVREMTLQEYAKEMSLAKKRR